MNNEENKNYAVNEPPEIIEFYDECTIKMNSLIKSMNALADLRYVLAPRDDDLLTTTEYDKEINVLDNLLIQTDESMSRLYDIISKKCAKRLSNYDNESDSEVE